jgi:hypothetical protein
MEKITSASRQTPRFDFDLDDLLHPAQAFEHPRHVVEDPDLTLNEKRAILASWASDACAIEAAPALRRAPGTRHPGRFDDVMEALTNAGPAGGQPPQRATALPAHPRKPHPRSVWPQAAPSGHEQSRTIDQLKSWHTGKER